jgi:integrase
MRQDERVALTWGDVDMSGSRLRFERSVEDDSGGIVQLGDTETEASRRAIRLGGAALDALRTQRGRQMFRFRVLGFIPQQDTPVFGNGFGEAMKPRTLRKAFACSVKSAILPAISFHCLRHSAATLTLHAVAKTLGYSDLATTLRYYAHVLDEMESEGAAALDRIVGFA